MPSEKNPIFEVVKQIVDELQAHVWQRESRTIRRLGGPKKLKLERSVTKLVCNSVAVASQRARVGDALIDLNRNNYGARNTHPNLTYSIHIERAFQGMVELGYLAVVRKGHYNSKQGAGQNEGKQTRYRATEKLIGHFSAEQLDVFPAIAPVEELDVLIRVRIKDKTKKRAPALPAIRTNEVIHLEQQLRKINQVLAATWIDVARSDDEISNVIKRKQEETGKDRSLDLTRRQLHRGFNSQDLGAGGRFFSGFWISMPKELRPYIVINGHPTVEIDFSRQHPTLLYALEGLDPPRDAYEGVIDRLRIDDQVDRSELRTLIKKAFNAMLNAKTVLRRPPTGIKPSKFDLKWQDINDAILDLHNPVAQHFYTGVGLKLQRWDSDIAERVMLQFANYGIPVLPVHDSFIVQDSFEVALRIVMNDEFIVSAWHTPGLKLTGLQRTGIVESPTVDLDSFQRLMTQKTEVRLTDGNAGYERRLKAFWK